ncbi:MAG: fibronectin type III domain-containing protein, partial [Bacteroidales bacterium]|nr:fibronectin type III domain-containing protein [Bacteroidales bacterium]
NDFVVQYRAASATAWDTTVAVNDTTYTVNGLNAASNYVFRVGYLCNNDTLWTSNLNVQTTCDLLPVPYMERFDSPTGTLPPCWDYTNPSYFHWNRWTTHSETSGNGELMVGSGSAYEFAILPEFSANFSKLEISFDAKLGNVSEGDSILMGVYDATTGTVTVADRLAIAGQSRENFVRFTYNYINYSGTGNRIAIGHSHNNPSDWGMALDSIVVIQLPDCYPPENVEAHNTMYPSTADDVYFTWTTSGVVMGWQIYIDTITSTVDIDSVPDSLLINVTDSAYYHVPFNSLAYGAHYRFFVRSNCGYEHSNWVELQNGFATDEVWMNNSSVADTVVGCDFIVYDNGGPVAGYLHNSNSSLVLISGDAGRELQLQGGFFSHGADANTLTVYDGIGTTGDVLYSRSQTNLTETIDSVLATSTTGAMTITFTSGYYAALGYELYIHCVGTALCARPIRLNVEMTSASEADAEWEGTASFYNVYYKLSGETTWSMDTTHSNSYHFTGLTPDTTYDIYVVADCDTNGTSTPSVTIQLNTHYDVVILPCDPVTNLAVSNVTSNSATLSWTSTADAWEIELTNVSGSTNLTASTNPYTLTGLLPNLGYSVRVRALCNGQNYEPTSEWSAAVTFTTDTVSSQGIDGADFVGSFVLYPNPATTTVTLDLTGVEDAAIVSIIDLNGREVFAEKAGGAKMTVNVAGFAKGAYFVRVTGSNTTAVRKLIVK